MEQKEGKTIYHYMRLLHRDIGYIVIGLTLIFSISGIVLIYRDTSFLKTEKLVEKTVSPNMEVSELGKVLHLRDIKIQKEEGEIVYFHNGTYNKATGEVKYLSEELPMVLNKFINVHKSSSRNVLHWFTLIYGVLLLFLTVSSFWMYKPKTKMFIRSIYFAGIGIVIAFIILLL